MEVSDLKDLFFILGVLVSIVFVLGIVMISVIKLHDFIAECIYAKRYEYMIKHPYSNFTLKINIYKNGGEFM